MTRFIPKSEEPLIGIFYQNIATDSFFTHFYGAKTEYEVHVFQTPPIRYILYRYYFCFTSFIVT